MPRLPHPRTSLSGFADARLPAWRRALVSRHLRGCTRCAVQVAEIRGLGEMLRATPSPVGEVPDALIDRLLAISEVSPDPTPDLSAPDPVAPDPVAPGAVAPDPVAPDPATPDPVSPDPVSPGPVSPDLVLPVRPRITADGAHQRPSVGAAGVLVAAVVMVGTVGAGAVVTGVALPWPSATVRASVSTVLPRLWTGGTEPGGAVSVRPVDNRSRP